MMNDMVSDFEKAFFGNDDDNFFQETIIFFK